MIPFRLHRRIPFIRRPFYQRDRALAERDSIAAERGRLKVERGEATAALAAVVGSRGDTMSLWEEFLNHNGRPIHEWAHDFPVYERHFSRYVNQPVTIFEIGCGGGGSLQMWKRYFGPNALIVGIDIEPGCADFAEDQIAVCIGDQSDANFLGTVIERFGAPDIVLDDGSHVMEHVGASFSFLYPRTAADGVYMVEDLHTAYWDDFGGGLNRAGSFIERCKGLLDELNANWTGGALAPTDFTRSTVSMHFYDSIAVFERGPVPERRALMIPDPAGLTKVTS
jgi:cephalosporin hydroxylase